MAWTIEVTAEFEVWWNRLDQEQQISVDGMMRVIELHGPELSAPYSVEVAASRLPGLRQFRIPHGDEVVCVLAACQPAGVVILLTGAVSGIDEPCATESVDTAELVYQRFLRAHGS